jgi:hypothetical protein
VVETSLNFFYLAIMLLITSYMSFALFGISAARQVRQIRSNALLATLRQEMVCGNGAPNTDPFDCRYVTRFLDKMN